MRMLTVNRNASAPEQSAYQCGHRYLGILWPLPRFRQKGIGMVIDFTLDSQTVDVMGIVGDRMIDFCTHGSEGDSVVVGTNTFKNPRKRRANTLSP